MKQNIRISPVEPNRGALDFSHLLDAPAGCHGFVRVKKGHFTFEDGKRARFLGFNIATRSNTPTHEDAEKLAARTPPSEREPATGPAAGRPRCWIMTRAPPASSTPRAWIASTISLPSSRKRASTCTST